MQTIRLTDVKVARPFVPPDLDIVSVLPGKTLSVVYFGEYGPGSELQYNELIVSPALTRRGRNIRFWISHIYVDNEDSMAGGREIWGLPKEMAQFSWSEDRHQVEMQQDGRLICRLHSGKRIWTLPLPVVFPTFSILGSDLLSFTAKVRGRLGISRSHLDVPADSPFAGLGLSGKGWATSIRNMSLTAGAPQIVRQRAAR